MAISLPLDAAACAQADDVFYCANQAEPRLFDATGGRVPLSADDPTQEPLRTMWCDWYEDILAHNRDGSRPFPSCGHGHVHHAADCPHCHRTPTDIGIPGDPQESDPDADPVDPIEHCPCEDEPEPEPRIRLRATMFFDGTGNNRDNVEAGTGRNDDDSYAAGFSNVALLEWAQITPAPELTEHISIYVEGMGTTSRGDDDNEGYALGSGSTSGIMARVNRGITELLGRIRTAAASGDPIEYIHLDAVGFSRGAASARHFVHVAKVTPATAIETRLRAEGYDLGEVLVKFVGLFDTVASYGVNHDNDTAELGLRAISVAERVVQLAAAEEHRSNFRLTNIDSAGNGTEIFLPGVHSDVGGGYADLSNENNVQLFDINSFGWNSEAQTAALERERTWLVDSGWYLAAQLQPTTWTNEIIGTRNGLRNTYSRIPLQMMAVYARDAGLSFTDAVENNHPITGDILVEASSAIWAAIAAGLCGAPSAWFGKDPVDDPPWHKRLRNTHLHFSALYGAAASWGTMYPRFNPDPVTGHRERQINAG